MDGLEGMVAQAGGVTPTLVIGVVVVAVMMLLKAQILFFIRKRSLKGMPSPPGSLPFLGHALQLGSGAPWDTMMDWVSKYGRDANGRLVMIDFLMETGVIITDPQHLRHVMDKNQKNYPKDVDLAYKPFLHILGTGLVTSQGDSHRKQRRLVAPSFRVEILEETAGVAKRAVDRLSRKLEAVRGTGKPIEIAEEFRVMTLQVICELILSLPPEESAEVFPKLYLPIVEEANLRVWQPWRAYMPTYGHWKFLQTVHALNAYVSDIIRKRWAVRQEKVANGEEAPAADILDRVLSAVDPSTWGEGTVRQLRDEIKTFLLAGHETSASMLTWSLYELTQHPEQMERARAEGRSVFPTCRVPGGDGDSDEFAAAAMPGTDKMQSLTYTVNVLKESLRRYTLVPMVTRECKDADEIGGQAIPAGSKIFINVKSLHLNEKLWPQPLEFDPTRFEADFDKWNFNAFINGPRNCLGQHLALLEARIVLSLLIQRFDFKPADDKCGLVHEYMVPTCPAEGMHLFVN